MIDATARPSTSPMEALADGSICGLDWRNSSVHLTRHRSVFRSSLKNLADPGVRRLLNHVKQLVAFDGQIEFWADGLSFANAFSHPHVQLRNVERKPCQDPGGTSDSSPVSRDPPAVCPPANRAQ